MTIRHVSQHVDRPAGEVAAYVRSYERLPEWATGLAAGVVSDGGRWFTESPMGRVEVRFVEDNPYGVCDHDVTLPDGSVTTNPLRAIADGPGACDVVFTLRQAPGVADADFEADAAAVAADLAALARLLSGP